MNKKVRLCVVIQFLFASALAAQLCRWMDPDDVAAARTVERSRPETGIVDVPENTPSVVLRPQLVEPLPTPTLRLTRRSNGFHGLHIPFEPSLARLNFHKALPYRNTWMGGGYAGIDINPYVGFRGFVFKAVNFGKVKLDYEKMNMYGAEFRLRLPVTTGLTPTVMLGGGYLNLNRNYKPRAEQPAPNRCFFQGGVGLNLLPSSRFQIQCGVRGLVLRHADAGSESASGNHLYGSLMYNLGVRFVFCRKKSGIVPQ